LALAFTGLLLAGSSCSPEIVGADAAVYSNMKLHAVANEDLTAVYNASVKAIETLELDITESAKDVFSARVLAKGADGKKVAIVITPREDGMTALKIGVGAVGNRVRSERIYDLIKKNLGD